MEKFEAFKNAIFEAAIKLGCSAAETYYVEGEAFDVSILDGDVDRYNANKKSACNVRVKLLGKDGYAYTEVLEDPEKIVKRAIDNARSIETEDEHPMQGKSEYISIPVAESCALSMTNREKINLMIEAEKLLKAADERISRVEECAIETIRQKTRIDNTLGLSACSEKAISFSILVPIMQQGEESKSTFAFRMGKETTDIDAIVKEAVSELSMRFGASAVKTGQYKVLLRHDAAAALLSTFSDMFSAEAAQKGLSLLNGKENEIIASDLVTILDDPFYGEFQTAFDAEGVPGKTKTVVDNGVLKTLLHNLKTAKKAGVETTGNAGRASIASPISVMPTNFFIKPGEKTYDDLIETMKDGLVITEFDGLHAGANSVTGEFSLLAKGFLIENGKIMYPVDQITVAGSFLDLMKAVIAIGSDIRMDPSDGTAMISSPSLLISSLMISGK
ncbi:MAG: TldD/PmbA family protein [Clostridia bacterium]